MSGTLKEHGPRATGNLSDGSGTITGPSTSQQIFAANPFRRYFFFQNQSLSDMWINFGTTAVIGQPSMKIPADGVFAFEDGFVDGQVINVIAVSSGGAFVAKEY